MSEKNEKSRKIVLITGAARRLGNATALKLHSLNMDIIVHYNNSSDEADKLVSKMNLKRQNSAISVKFNLRDFANYKNILSALDEKWKNIDVLINNASTFYPTNIDLATTDEWDDLHDVNLKSPFFLSKLFHSSLKKNKGCIINIIDIHADRPLEEFSIYSMAKAGLKMLTKSLALEFGPEIRVNGVSPGSVMWPENKEYESKQQEIIESTALKRQGDRQDIASTCAFLINDADYITGQIINVDGGRSLSR
jgi:pteridine reductase